MIRAPTSGGPMAERDEPKFNTGGVDASGFMNSALGSVPTVARAFIGTILGAAVAIVFVLVIGGMQGPVTRLANAYAARVEQSALSVAQSSKLLSEQVDKLAGVIARLEVLETKTTATQAVINDHEIRLLKIESENRQFHKR